MAFATKYRFRFQATNGHTYSIFIEKDGYTGSIIDRALGRSPILKKEQNGPIHGTSLEFFAECNVDQEFAELYTTSAKEYRVRLLMGTTTIWTGFVSPELYSEPDIAPPYDVDIIATDGIGELKMYDFEPQGKITVEEMLQYLIGHSALDTTYRFVSSMEGVTPSVESDDFLTELSIDLDHMVGDSCYNVLTHLLETLHATITWYMGTWYIVRETNVADTDNIPTATLNEDGWWPVGNTSTKVEPAKNKVTVQSPLHTVVGGVKSVDMEDDSDWEIEEHGSPMGRLFFSDKAGRSPLFTPLGKQCLLFQCGPNQGFFNYEPCSKSVYQEVSFSDGLPELTLSIKAGVIHGDYCGYVVLLSYEGEEFTKMYLAPGENGTTWISNNPTSEKRDSASFDEMLRGQWNGVVWKDFQYTIPSVELPGTLRLEIWQKVLTTQTGQMPTDANAQTIISRCGLIPSSVGRGWQDTIVIDNGARSSAENIEISGGRVDDAVKDIKTMLKGVFWKGTSLVERIADANIDSDTWLGFITKDNALSVAVPRLITSGTLNVPSRPPMMFEVGSYNAWVEHYEWDLYNSEMTVELRSLPAVEMEIESENITEIPEGSASGGSGGTSGGGSYSRAVVELEMPNGFTVEGSPVRNVGKFTVGLEEGYNLLAPEQAAVLSMFEYDATTRTLILKKDGDNERHFAAYGDISAGGIGQGGSGGDGILAMYIKTPSGRVRIDDIDTRAAEFGIKVNGTLATPVDGVISINTASGSVTSVALSVPTGFSVTGSPVTSSGTLAIGFASGYSLPTTAKQTSWDNKQDAITESNKLAYSLISGTPDLSDMATMTWVLGKGYATESFVNSSIATATATFRGTSASGLTEAQFLAWANGLTKDNNDYVFWNTTDAAGNVQFKRYKYNGTSWVYEYTLNNSSFTQAQWAAINSGLTSSDKTALDNALALIATYGNIVTHNVSEFATAAQGEKADSAYQKPSTGIPYADLSSGVKGSLDLADSALQSHQTIYALTIQKNGATVDTYTPNSAAKTINITDVASAQTLSDLKTWIESMFEKDTTSIAGTTLIKAKFGLYSEQDISAGGVGQGGSGGGIASIILNGNTILPDADGKANIGSLATAAQYNSLAGRVTTLEGKATAVSYSPTVTSGTALGIITIDGTGHTIYAPTIPTALKNPTALSWSGYSSGSYDGSEAKSISIPTTLPASDVYAWAKAANKPSYAFSEITGTASASQIPALDASKITTGQFADARIASASTWNAKQNSLGTGTNGQILSWQNGAPAWVAAPATGVTKLINRTGEITQAQLRSDLGLGSLAYENSLGWANLTNNANSLDEGTSDVTDNTELLTSYASNNGFSDPNAVGKVYKRDAIKVYNYVKTKLGLGSAAYTDSSAYATATQGSHADTAYGWGNATNYESGSLASLTTNALDHYYAGGGNQVTDKPSGVDAFGLFTMRCADGWHGQILMSSNQSTGLYWRVASSLNGGWRTIYDSGNLTASVITTTLGNTAVAKATDADTLDGHHGSYYAAASSLGNYLPLAGGNITGNLTVQNNTVYHSGNCNNASTPWSASSLTLGDEGRIYLHGNNTYGSSEWKILAYGPIMQISDGTNNQAVSISADNIRFFQNGNGNVGIGTGSPSEKLHVAGNVLATGNLLCTASTQIIGTSSAPWGEIHANKWYPKAGDTSTYIEFDATANAFKVHGNIVATGGVTAGA